jgi:hypothetical protein
MALGRAAGAALTGISVEAVVSMSVSGSELRVGYGSGVRQVDIGDLARLLRERYAGELLIVELPLWRPNDPGIGNCEYETLVCGSEVYGAIQLTDDIATIEVALRATDPSFSYNAFVIKKYTSDLARTCPAEWVASGSAGILAVLVGAYDGEGFVLASTLR